MLESFKRSFKSCSMVFELELEEDPKLASRYGGKGGSAVNNLETAIVSLKVSKNNVLPGILWLRETSRSNIAKSVSTRISTGMGRSVVFLKN